MAENLQDKLRERAKSFVTFSIAVDESPYINSTNQLTILPEVLMRILTSLKIQHGAHVLDMVPMTDPTSEKDLFLYVEKSREKFNADLTLLCPRVTDMQLFVRTSKVLLRRSVITLDLLQNLRPRSKCFSRVQNSNLSAALFTRNCFVLKS